MTQGLDSKITLIIEGGAVTDEQSEQLYQIAYDCIQVGLPFTFTCSSENFFNRLRVGIAEGQLNHSLVVFVYQGVKFHANQYGAVHDWPRDMLEYSIQMCERIITGSMERRQQDREKRERELLNQKGWLVYSEGEFVEDLNAIANLCGSTLYEVFHRGGVNYVRRIKN